VATEPINIPITTSYDDEGAKDALEDAEKLDKLEPSVEIDVDTTQAKDAVEEVSRPLDELIAKNPWIAEVKADIGSAHADLDRVQQDLKDTGGAAKDTGGHVKTMGNEADQSGSVLANMVGNSAGEVAELGGVAGTAGMAIGQLGEYATEGNISLKGLAKVAGPMAGLTAVTMALAQGAKQAAEAEKKLGEEIDALSTASDEAALQGLTGMMLDQFKAGHDLSDIWTKITEQNIEGARRLLALMEAQGATTEQTKGLTAAITAHDEAAARAKETTDKYGDAVTDAATDTDVLASAQDRAKQKADDLNAAIGELSGLLDIQRAAEDFDADINQAMSNTLMGVGNTREEIRGIEDDVLKAGEFTKQNPVVIAQTLAKVQAGDLQGAKADVDSWYRENPAKMTLEVVVGQGVLDRVKAGVQKSLAQTPVTIGGWSATPSAPATSQTVNVNLPRGARHGDIARAMGLSTRRNGRRYGNPSGTVSYARSR
jgi:hypothetical protein